MDEVGLGKVLQSARKNAGLTQQELCQKSGLSYSTLAKIERGAIKAPSIFTIQAIGAALGTDLNTLLGVMAPKGGKTLKRSKSGVKFVYFDVNGCLVRFFHRAFTKLAADTGALPDKVETVFWHYNDAVCRGDMNLNEFNEQLAKQLGLKDINWQFYYMEAVDPIKEMHEVVSWAAQHYGIGLLTNIMPGFVDIMMERGLIPKLEYDVIIDSSEVGVIKPEAKIYEIAGEKTEVEPSEILLVDDSRTNLMAAGKFGWHVMWFDDYRPEESAAKVKAALQPEN